jgi:flagellar hook-associated protein 1 FlgK
MSITTALSVALSGLGAVSRGAEIASSNLANVLTEGYAARSLELGVRSSLSGVSVLGVNRNVDEGLLGDRMLATADTAFAQTQAEFAASFETSIGSSDDESSLAGRVVAFEASLVAAASRPDQTVRLDAVVDAGQQIVNKFNSINDRLQNLRSAADVEISKTVTDINTGLQKMQTMNEQIIKAKARGQSTVNLMDQRQVLLNQLSEYLPLRQVPRDNGALALFTTGGVTLLDTRAAQLEFTGANVVAPHMTLENGLLSGLSVNGVEIPSSGPRSPIAGGRLSGLFSVRDELSVTAQTRVDALARNLVERFQSSTLDDTRPPGSAGLFTDDGAAFASTNEVGLSGRLSLNPAVDTAQGGQSYRIRDGLNTTFPGPSGDAALIQNLQRAVGDDSELLSSDLPAAEHSFSGHLGNLASVLGHERLALDQALSFSRATEAELTGQENEMGVDSDAEMQNLLVLEQLYAANAKMIQTLDEMMQTLLRI